MSSQQRDCLCATKGLNKYKEMGRKKFHQQFLTMFFKEITCHGAIAPLTGCKLKSFYILKGQLSNNFYCLQSDLPYRPAELPWLTLVQQKSEARQSGEVGEVHMSGRTTVPRIHGAPSSPRLPNCCRAGPRLARQKGRPGYGTQQRQGRVSAATIHEAERSCISPHTVARDEYLICMKQWPCHLSPTNAFLSVLQRVRASSHGATETPVGLSGLAPPQHRNWICRLNYLNPPQT